MFNVLHPKNKGFTLVELLVVIAIIGILSSVVIASLNSARQKARDAKRISDIKQIQLALEMFQDSCGRYPVALVAAPANCTVALSDFLSTIPTGPTGDAYSYAAFGTGATAALCTGTDYHLGATLEADNVVLDGDKDDAAATSGLCVGNTDFDGADATAPFVYDVTP